MNEALCGSGELSVPHMWMPLSYAPEVKGSISVDVTWVCALTRDDDPRWRTLEFSCLLVRADTKVLRGLVVWRQHGFWPPHSYQGLSLHRLWGDLSLVSLSFGITGDHGVHWYSSLYDTISPVSGCFLSVSVCYGGTLATHHELRASTVIPSAEKMPLPLPDTRSLCGITLLYAVIMRSSPWWW